MLFLISFEMSVIPKCNSCETVGLTLDLCVHFLLIFNEFDVLVAGLTVQSFMFFNLLLQLFGSPLQPFQLCHIQQQGLGQVRC